MFKLIKEYLQTGIDCHRQTTLAQEAVCLSFNLNAKVLTENVIIQKTEHFREKERVFNKIKFLNKNKKKTEQDEKELLSLIEYIDHLV